MNVRRLLLLALLLILIPLKADAIPVRIQSCSGNQPSGGTGVASCTLTLGAGHTVFVAEISYSGTLGLSDTLVLTYTQLFPTITHSFGGPAAEILEAQCAPTGAGGSDTFSASTGATFNGGVAVLAIEYSGVATCASDGNNSSFGTTVSNGVTVSSSTAVTTHTDFLIAFSYTFAQSSTAGTGYTLTGDTSTFDNSGIGGGNNTITAEHILSAAPGTHDGSFVIPTAGIWEAGFGALGPIGGIRHRARVICYHKAKRFKVLLANSGARH